MIFSSNQYSLFDSFLFVNALIYAKQGAICMMDSNFQIRDLEESDYDRGYIKLLSNLTETGNISKNAFLDRYKMLKNNGNYVIRVIVDKENDKIIASGTLLIEHKFIHECADKGHIEDIVVDSGYRNQSLGKKMISDLTEIGEKKGLYKISLVCRDEVTGFYEKCGFELKEKEMVKYYK